MQELSPEDIKEKIRSCIMRDICFASNQIFEENKSLYGIEGSLTDAVVDFYNKEMTYVQSHDYASCLDLQTPKAEITEISKQLLDVLRRRVDALDSSQVRRSWRI